eukprot:5574835-Amphidinium_carterae.1
MALSVVDLHNAILKEKSVKWACRSFRQLDVGVRENILSYDPSYVWWLRYLCSGRCTEMAATYTVFNTSCWYVGKAKLLRDR